MDTAVLEMASTDLKPQVHHLWVVRFAGCKLRAVGFPQKLHAHAHRLKSTAIMLA